MVFINLLVIFLVRKMRVITSLIFKKYLSNNESYIVYYEYKSITFEINRAKEVLNKKGSSSKKS